MLSAVVGIGALKVKLVQTRPLIEFLLKKQFDLGLHCLLRHVS